MNMFKAQVCASVLAFAACPALADGAKTVASDSLATAPADAASVNDAGATVYPAAFFTRFNPANAWDMVARIPGFSVDFGDAERRGFGGTAGNVLIDGERPSTKQTLDTFLRRISPGAVERIEIVRGGGAGLDVRGQSVIANVILVEGEGAGEGSWTLIGRGHRGGRISNYADVSLPFVRGALSGTISAQANTWASRAEREESLRQADGTLLKSGDEYRQERFVTVEPSFELKFDTDAPWVATLNGRYERWDWSEGSEAPFYDAAGALLEIERGRSTERDAYAAELGGDWERELGEGSSIKLIGLAVSRGWEFSQGFESTNAQTSAFQDFDLTSPTQSVERVGRLVYTRPMGAAHALEMGGEIAFNSRDTDLAIIVDDGSGATALDLPVAKTLVEERRAEVFVNDVWTVSDTLSLDYGFAFEASRITQSGDASQEREFTYPKPHASLTWTAANADQWRFSVTRDISQLDFGQFASSVQFSDDQVDIGNADLEPEKAWELRAEWERRFGDDAALTLTAAHDLVNDVADITPILNGEGPGNLGDGTRTWIGYDATLPLDRIGLKDATLDLEGEYGRSSVTDPLTGRDRAFSDWNDWRMYFEFRQDLPARSLAWGGDYFQGSSISYFRRNEEQKFSFRAGDLDLWVETTALKPVTIRLGVDQLLDPERRRTRTFFVGDRGSGVVERVETQAQTFGPLAYVRISGTF